MSARKAPARAKTVNIMEVEMTDEEEEPPEQPPRKRAYRVHQKELRWSERYQRPKNSISKKDRHTCLTARTLPNFLPPRFQIIS